MRRDDLRKVLSDHADHGDCRYCGRFVDHAYAVTDAEVLRAVLTEGCEGCGGIGYIEEAHEPWAVELLGCFDCEGRGWVPKKGVAAGVRASDGSLMDLFVPLMLLEGDSA